MNQSRTIQPQNSVLPGSTINVALVGNPNTGKTSVFNALTGLHQKVGNYPGVTVEKKTGRMLDAGGKQVLIHDLPGLYSLTPRSPDDRIAIDFLRGRLPDVSRVDLVVVVADATNLSRNLYLAGQIQEMGLPVLLVLNMIDLAEKSGLRIDQALLSQEMGMPVVAVAANKGRGIVPLRSAIIQGASSTAPRRPLPARLPQPVAEALAPLQSWLKEHSPLPPENADLCALQWVSDEEALQEWIQQADGHLPDGGKFLKELVQESRSRLQHDNLPWRMLDTQLRYQHIDRICAQAVQQAEPPSLSWSDRLDRILTHRWAGPLAFLLIFAVVFQSIFTWAQVPMDALQSLFDRLGVMVSNLLPAGLLQEMIVDGAITGVGAILVFLPQILFLFFFLALLEDSGYMARVAFIMDRLMRGLGLTGRSVVPLLSSFACAVPGIMATRTIQNSRDRLITIMIAPFMSCSARLPVYTLMIAAFIPDRHFLGIFSLAGLTLLAMYLIGIGAAIVSALLFNKMLRREKRRSTFVMELPPYRLPSLKLIGIRLLERGKVFVSTAGRIILAISLVLWFLATFPRAEKAAELTPAQKISQSYAGTIGHWMEPALKPLGFDWKIGIGLITSFAAREVMVSTMATLHNVESADETSPNLRSALKNDRDPVTGKPIYTPLVAISLMVFFVLACQCMATVAVVKRETNSWRWPLFMILYMTALAYLGSLIVFQLGSLLGWS